MPGASGSYIPWTQRRSSVNISLAEDAETASLIIDSTDTMWIASDGEHSVEVRYSQSPYDSWVAQPVVLEQNIESDDIAAIARLNNNSIGVMWSNQVTRRFGFRVHLDGDDPQTWSQDEVPASQSASGAGGGMADDHINLAVTSSGELFAAVKTSFDAVGEPKIGLLKRQVNGTWDDLYVVDYIGTRPIIVINETDSFLTVLYSSQEGGGDLVYKESDLSSIQFGIRKLLLAGGAYTDVSSVGGLFADELVVIASGDDSPVIVDSVMLQRP